MALESLDIRRRSASQTSPPDVRKHVEVAKLIDISRCIGCKACQVACMEWNDVRDDVGSLDGSYNNPIDLTDRSWTVMRFYEEEIADKGLQWLIVKDGCLHCADPGLPQGVPGARRDRAVLERHRGLQAGQLHRLRLLPDRLSVQHPALRRHRRQGLQVHALLRSRRGRARAGVHQDLSRPRRSASGPRRT